MERHGLEARGIAVLSFGLDITPVGCHVHTFATVATLGPTALVFGVFSTNVILLATGTLLFQFITEGGSPFGCSGTVVVGQTGVSKE